MQGLLNNPLFLMGTGILANNGQVGKGLQQGLLGMRQNQVLDMRRKQQEQAQSNWQKSFDATAAHRQATLAASNQAKPFTLSPGQVRYGADGQVSQSVPAAAPKLPAGMRLGANGQPEWIPGYLDGKRSVSAAGAARLYENRLPTDERLLRDDILHRAKGAREYNSAILAQGQGARSSIANYDRALALLEKIPTGALEETKVDVKRYAKAMGFDVDTDKIASAEELQTLLGDQVMARVAQTKGAVSEKEMELFKQYSANFGKTTEGNRAILTWAKAKAERDMEIAQLVRKMQRSNKSSTGIRAAVDDYVGQNSISSHLQGDTGAGTSKHQSLSDEDLLKQIGGT
ncbi:MAG: hypothetical protein GY746_07470 [Gammaproteobacteria bacterium]|nr:hypothetical protein [Gammaproteobacteria bacterium]